MQSGSCKLYLQFPNIHEESIAADVCTIRFSSVPGVARLHTIGTTRGNSIPIVPNACSNTLELTGPLYKSLTDPVVYAMKYPMMVVSAGKYSAGRLPPLRLSEMKLLV